MPGFHLLTRFETDAHAFGFGLDLSVGTQEETTDAFSSRTTGAARWSFGLDYAYFFSPLDSSSVYAGSGLGYSGDVVGERSGAGFYASPTLGMESFRTSAARVSMELRSTLPLYQIESSSGSAKWNPGISLIYVSAGMFLRSGSSTVSSRKRNLLYVYDPRIESHHLKSSTSGPTLPLRPMGGGMFNNIKGLGYGTRAGSSRERVVTRSNNSMGHPPTCHRTSS